MMVLMKIPEVDQKATPRIAIAYPFVERDMDVLSASFRFGDSKIAWYENNGSGAFGPQQIITTAANGANYVYAADLDSDGDMDVLSASGNDDKIAWYENTDGSGGFGSTGTH